MNDIATTDTRTLQTMAHNLKYDALALFYREDEAGRNECRRLFRLFKEIARELHRRNNPAIAHKMN